MPIKSGCSFGDIAVGSLFQGPDGWVYRKQNATEFIEVAFNRTLNSIVPCGVPFLWKQEEWDPPILLALSEEEAQVILVHHLTHGLVPVGGILLIIAILIAVLGGVVMLCHFLFG